MRTKTTRRSFLVPLARRLRPFVLLTVLVGVGVGIGAVTARGGWDLALGTGAPTYPEVLRPVPQGQGGTVSPLPWYRTTWALVAYGVGAAGLLALCMRSRTVQLEKQQQALTQQVDAKTSEVRRQKRQLEAYNRELLRSNEVLRKTIEEKSKLLGMAAHDLKNPLFGVRALAEIVLESEPLSAKGERKLTLIRESADETLHLIEELLSSAANSVTGKDDTEPVDVAALAQWVVQSFAPHAEHKKQTLRCSVEAEGACVVEGDKRKLREAINNLVSNALKYSAPGETVEVRVDRANGDVRVSVIDAGPGLSEADQKRLFAPFQRLTPRPTGEEGSSGLGLYIVKQIADGHDGAVEVETALGDGSTFTLVLPATIADTDPVPETNPQALEL